MRSSGTIRGITESLVHPLLESEAHQRDWLITLREWNKTLEMEAAGGIPFIKLCSLNHFRRLHHRIYLVKRQPRRAVYALAHIWCVKYSWSGVTQTHLELGGLGLACTHTHSNLSWVLHGDDHLGSSAGHQIHGSTHSLHHLTLKEKKQNNTVNSTAQGNVSSVSSTQATSNSRHRVCCQLFAFRISGPKHSTAVLTFQSRG